MAATEFGVNHPLAVKKWSYGLAKEALKQTYAFRFMSKGSGSLCQIKDELKDAGDKITFGLRMQLTGSGKTGDDTLEGEEESLTLFSDSVLINQLRHGTRSKGKMSEQRVPYAMREEGRDALADWYAGIIDESFNDRAFVARAA